MARLQPDFAELSRYAGVGAAKITVEVVECPHFDSPTDADAWRRRVARESDAAQTHFFTPAADGYDFWPLTADGSSGISLEGLPVFASELLRRGAAGPGSQLRLRTSDGPEQVLTIPQACIPIAPTFDRVRTPAGLRALAAEDSARAWPRLEEQLRSPLGVMPFVGAGMSAPFGFPQWTSFLDSLAARFVDDDGELARLRGASDLESLAQRLWERGQNAFQDAIDESFGRRIHHEQLRTGALATLARLVDGPVITTNFDRVLEDTFEACGRPFKEAVHGPKPDRIVRAIHCNRRALLKIHGDALDRADRTFTRSEYDRRYTPGEGGATLSSLGWLVFIHRPLLFLVCSLEKDRTVDVMARVQRELAGISHFAVLAAPLRERKLAARRQQLSEWGVVPLWFPPGEFGQIERYLVRMLHTATTRTLRPALATLPRPGNAAADPIQAEAAPRRRKSSSKAIPAVQRIASAIANGRVTFLLGNYIHLGATPTGDAFYRRMAERFEVQFPLRDRTEVARVVLQKHGAAELLEWYRAEFELENVAASEVIRFLASLPGLLRSSDRAREAGLTLLTTNFDRVLEREFERIGEPIHLYYYLNAGPDCGRFAYRAPDGSECIVERPEHFTPPDDNGTCIVKLNGGLLGDSSIPHSLCVAKGDFENLASRLPACLPAGIRSRIESRSMLCLGHGLYELDVEQLIRHVQNTGAPRSSWAVQLVPQRFRADFAGRQIYWREHRLELVEHDLGKFVKQLRRELAL